MKGLFTPAVAAAALFLTGPLYAQEPAPQPAQPSPGLGEPVDVSDEDLETFADIYVALEQTLSEYEEELANAESQEEAQQAQARLQEDAFARIAEHGWTPDQYNRVVQAVNADATLREKAIALIEER